MKIKGLSQPKASGHPCPFGLPADILAGLASSLFVGDLKHPARAELIEREVELLSTGRDEPSFDVINVLDACNSRAFVLRRFRERGA